MSKYEQVVTENGEVGVFVPDSANAIIRTPEEVERAKMFATLPARKRFHHGRNYFVSYNDAVAEIIKDLSLIEAGALIKLLLTLKMNGDGRIMSAGKSLNKADIARLLGRSRSATNEIIDRLILIGVLISDDTGFRIDEKFHVMGKMAATEVFTKMYTVRTREIIADLKLSEIGLLYKIIPFFHYSEYYLCVNSNADPKNIEYMLREGLAEAIGHAPATVTRLVSRLQSAGAILVTGTRNEARYLVHPDLMFRQAEGTETKWTWAVRKMFDDHAKKAGR
ncbi:hypothetical protein MHZ92_19910 [Sporosarcina sp. ACRSL]|uniref:hypothetical protein n=1 Tax=Sporosarcina sp. ACRSL TaxID=2918215 RepID=UPI001EF54AB3|nr:hypothetical protein [Sporosarcina sp. ACRSL]MCG7346374.1 hypothetical protein [Sporosarcina sp. ACRSL]